MVFMVNTIGLYTTITIYYMVKKGEVVRMALYVVRIPDEEVKAYEAEVKEPITKMISEVVGETIDENVPEEVLPDAAEIEVEPLEKAQNGLIQKEAEERLRRIEEDLAKVKKLVGERQR